MRCQFLASRYLKVQSFQEIVMKQLRSMSFDELLALKDEVESLIADRAMSVKKQLEAKLSQIEGYTQRSAGTRRQHGLKGRRLAPKYRNPNNRQETWAGRGIMPRWLKTLVAKGHKPAEFAVQKSAALRAGRAMKRGRAKK
jgi:DNA-binding protein H-NS